MTEHTTGVSGIFDSKPRKWRAKWIWAEDPASGKNLYFYFRQTFDLPAGVRGCRLSIAADTKYQLFLNEAFVGRGAPQSQPFFCYYDEHEVDRFLRPGRNCAAVLVNHLGTIADTRGGLLVEIEAEDGKTVLYSDDSWRVRRADAWERDTHFIRGNHMAPFQEFFDARKAPDGWTETSFDDAAWARATIVAGSAGPVGAAQSDRPPAAGPWSLLVARDIPFMRTTTVLPAAIERIEEGMDLANRCRPNDLAPGLSMAGRAVCRSRVEGAANLCAGRGETVLQCSPEPRGDACEGRAAPAIVLDFGRIVTARLRMDFDGAADGFLDIGYAERLIDGHFNIAMEGEFADRIIMKEGPQIYEPFHWRAFRFVKLRLRNCSAPVTIRRLEAAVDTYPYEDRGGFDSTDQTLNAVWGISRETVRLCSNECIMDTPWRESAQWLGDVALVTVPAIYACFGDVCLPGKFFRQAAHNQHPTGMLSNTSSTVNHGWLRAIPDYSLWWVQGLWQHYMYTGQPEWVHRFYAEAVRVFHAHLPYLNERGLIEDMPYWVFIDWARTERRGESTAYNAILYATLKSLLAMSRLKGDDYAANMIEGVRAKMRRNFKARLFDPARGGFADANLDGDLSSMTSEHANMAAIYAGLCDNATARQVIKTVFESGTGPCTEAQPFFASVVLQALDMAGRFDLALDYVRCRWGRRMVALGATSTFEEWSRDGSSRDGRFVGFLRSNSHAWSASPASFLIANMMGLRILEPGCRRVAIEPKRTDFDWSAAYPTPCGLIRVRYEAGRASVEAPPEMAVERRGAG
jgi:hypothetical protein